MSRFVLDCSVAMAWCFEDEVDSYSENVLNAMPENEIIVPSLLFLEVANVLLLAEHHRSEEHTSELQSH